MLSCPTHLCCDASAGMQGAAVAGAAEEGEVSSCAGRGGRLTASGEAVRLAFEACVCFQGMSPVSVCQHSPQSFPERATAAPLQHTTPHLAVVLLQGDAAGEKEKTSPAGKVCLAGSSAAAAACVRCCRP